MARFSAEKKEGVQVGILGFLRTVVTATMGCFFGCFRLKDSRSNLSSTPRAHKASRSENALSSLFLSDGAFYYEPALCESDDDSDRKKWEELPEEVDATELKDEAKFLKACGTLSETPVEIRKISVKCVDTSAQKEESPRFNSWIPTVSIEKLKLGKQPGESSTPVQIFGGSVTGTGSLVGTPSSCMTAGHDTRRESISSTQNSAIQNAITPKDVSDNETQWSAISSVSSGPFATTVKRTNKSVRFECHSDSPTFSSENSSQHSKKFESAGNFGVSKPSPYPTPLKLTDEMQTPGTIFPTYVNDIAGGKTTKIRSQYVYSVFNPIEYRSEWKELEEEKSDSNHLRESLNPNDEASLITNLIPGTLIYDTSVGNDRKDEPLLSPSVKPDLTNQDGNGEQFISTSGKKVHYGRTPGDRPILGMVAAPWKDEEATHISPKWWDGNGIPNSTTKYKEDQKVCWHATPFEERLEKALSEDTFISQRKRMSGTPPVEFNEIEESDTASSQLGSSAHLKSIVSF